MSMIKRDYFKRLRTIVEAEGINDNDDLIAFIDKEIAAIDKEQERKSEKTSAFMNLVRAELSDEPMTATMIAKNITEKTGEEISRNKVSTAMAKLFRAGEVTKSEIKTEDKKRQVAYTLNH